MEECTVGILKTLMNELHNEGFLSWPMMVCAGNLKFGVPYIAAVENDQCVYWQEPVCRGPSAGAKNAFRVAMNA